MEWRVISSWPAVNASLQKFIQVKIGKMDIYLQWIVAILMVLVNLDVHQIVGYHYFDHHQRSRGSSVRLL